MQSLTCKTSDFSDLQTLQTLANRSVPQITMATSVAMESSWSLPYQATWLFN